FAFVVTQQSFGPQLGQITISNIHYIVAPDAVDGPVNVDVTGIGPAPGVGQVFDSVVSNAIIGLQGNTTISSSVAVGVTKATCPTDGAGCAFSAKTAVTSKG